MQATKAAMGIRGIFPLIKQHAPLAIEKLSSLSQLPPGYRLAIDATLLVQRLHFADDAHASRHLIGIHRLARALETANVRPIMVFDNPAASARMPQKQRERARRKQARTRLSTRSLIEKLRRDRLGHLEQALAQWRSLKDTERAEVASLLRQWSESKAPLPVSQTATLLDRFSDHTHEAEEEAEAGPDESEIDQGALMSLDDAKLHEAVFVRPSSDLLVEDDWKGIDLAPLEELVLAAESDIKEWQARQPQYDGIWSEVKEAESSATIAIASRIDSARREYLHLQAAATAVSTVSKEGTEITEVSLPPETPAQAKMTALEGTLYAALESPQCREGDVTATSADAIALSKTTPELPAEEPLALTEIAAQNQVLGRAYARSSEPLSPQIFDDCADLCRLLNIPVLWTGDGSRTGGRAHEAEAMAAMLVRDGHADAVASEDSDVLLYDVKLLRGLVGSKGLELVDAKQVRLTLFPPQPAEDEASRAEADKASARKMLDFALLCGTDFNRTVAGIGSRRALKLMQTFGSINGIRQEVLRAVAQHRKDQRSPKQVRAPLEADEQPRIDKSMASMMAKFALPNGMTWREYSKELNQARDVFRRPPSLFKELRKLKGQGQAQLWPEPAQQSRDESDDEVERYLQSHGVRRNDPLDKDETETTTPQSRGFGAGLFKDGGPVASWSG